MWWWDTTASSGRGCAGRRRRAATARRAAVAGGWWLVAGGFVLRLRENLWNMLHLVAWRCIGGALNWPIKAHVAEFRGLWRRAAGGGVAPPWPVVGGWWLVVLFAGLGGFGRDTSSAPCFAPCWFAGFSKILRDRRLSRARWLGGQSGLRLLHDHFRHGLRPWAAGFRGRGLRPSAAGGRRLWAGGGVLFGPQALEFAHAA
jgi:hypothetical protein